MNERTLFVAALEKDDPAQRNAYLDEACAGDVVLRERVEALLRSHQREGQFLDVPAVEQLATGDVTQADTSPAADDVHLRAFLKPTDKPGSLGRLGHYEILEVIGRGGMGIVLRGFDEKLQRVVAIKVMAVPLATSAAARRRFTREAQAAAAVCHDHIVTIHAVEEADGLPYLVMQYVAGMSLQERLDSDRPLQLAEILRIGMQTASGLAAAHAQGLIHRDIKPANILLENGVERVKITDFGLARAADDASLTQSGVVAGTPQYMAPEQARGESVDQRADLFSLGSVLYAMCTGRAPFRASGTMAVMNRVCKEMPSPIREANPEIPDWLVAIVEKLHVKDPAERYQSAAAVAEVLGQHLAHVQHPSVMPLPRAEKPGDSPTSRRRLHWAAAAAGLLCILVGVGLAEATGVTQLTATVIRILTPDGTLVVETGDPGMKVTVEGDGGLIITGAGLEEIHLLPGSYRVHADKQGKPVPLDKDLVTVARGGRAVVRVKLESSSPTAASKAEPHAFVLLGDQVVAERKFDTLAEAVQGASDGDTIEIRGNGPFVTHPIVLGQGARIIRAGTGYRPVIRFVREDSDARDLIYSDASLTLEGLEFESDRPGPNQSRIAISLGPSLHVANCRFRLPDYFGIWALPGRGRCVVKNCEFLGCHRPLMSQVNGTEWVIDNCTQAGGGATLGIFLGSKAMTAKITRLTNLANHTVQVHFGDTYPPDAAEGENSSRLHLKVASSVLSGNFVLETVVVPERLGTSTRLGSVQYETSLQRRLEWNGEHDLYSIMPNSETGGRHFLIATLCNTNLEHLAHGPQTLDTWRKFWRTTETGSIEGPARFQGGDLSAKCDAAPERLTAEDFRLRPDSAGYRAGKDGKDLGADVDLVGPGPAYERWKKTPEYQEWLRDMKQELKAEVLRPEPQAFVLLGGQGVAERKFDTLANAVQEASDGDIIEIRGNGPFLIDAIEFQSALTIRAGAGFRPVFVVNPRSELISGNALVSRHPLRLEGLEFRGSSKPYRIVYSKGPLWAANCRFQGWVSVEGFDACVIHNCELLSASGAGLAVRCNSDASSEVANCILVGQINLDEYDVTRGATVRFSGNTLVSAPQNKTFFHTLYPMDMPADQIRNHSGKRLHLVATENIFASGNGVFCLCQTEAFKPRFDAGGAEAWIPRRVKWDEERNLFRTAKSYIGLWDVYPAREVPITEVALTRGKDLADWNRFWGLKDTGSSEGVIRFQGGDLFSRAMADAATLTPEDFRLRSDSAGYRAGKEGKDLGADVDLVGPGPAYDRWKETPEYEKWLEETRPLK